MLVKKKRKSKYMPYAQARAQALDLQLNSRADYIAWHIATKCQFLPRYPERVYKDWVSWNDWLGTANVFKGESVKPLRPFWEAVKWAQSHADTHGLDTMVAWLDWVREHGDELPADIPARPDQRYTEWKQVGWPGWLGTEVRARLTAARKSTGLLCICSHHNLRQPGNKYAVITAELGETELRQILGRERDLRVVRCYKSDNAVKAEVFAVFNKWGRDDGDGWFIPNVNEVLFELDQLLELYRGPQQ